ncbi:MAG: DUF1641 domain-containing protein [Deltaproteobacteria bacterium]|nr:DUF1641 domain-containing protein [Deltaproteobacteria bacterium]
MSMQNKELREPDLPTMMQAGSNSIDGLRNHAETLSEVAGAIQAYKDSQTDPMIERMAAIMEPLTALADQVAKPEVFQAVQQSVRTLTELYQSGSLNDLKEVALFISAAKNSMGDSVIARMAANMETMMALLDELAKADLMRAMPAIEELINSGSLEVLTQMATFLGSTTHAFTDSIVERMLSMFENLVSRLMNPQIQDLIGAAVESAQEAMAEMKDQPKKAGLPALWKAARDPEVRQSLLFVMSFARHFHQSLYSENGPKL